MLDSLPALALALLAAAQTAAGAEPRCGWVGMNGAYGYGCACLTVSTDSRTMRVTRIFAATPVPLRQCRADRALRRPS